MRRAAVVNVQPSPSVPFFPRLRLSSRKSNFSKRINELFSSKCLLNRTQEGEHVVKGMLMNLNGPRELDVIQVRDNIPAIPQFSRGIVKKVTVRTCARKEIGNYAAKFSITRSLRAPLLLIL